MSEESPTNIKKRPYEEDISEELDAQIKKTKTEIESVKKHSLDSDEEDSSDGQNKYEILNEDDIEALHSVTYYSIPMEEFKVVPDIISTIPPEILNVQYGAVSVTPGIELTPTAVKDEPKLKWNAEPGAYYTLIFVDPDVPPMFGFSQFVHWLVCDIPGTNVSAGTTVFDYMGSGPPQGSGLHRYIFMLYKQDGKLNASVTQGIKDESISDRGEFSPKDLVEKNNLQGPVAANFYRAQYDDYCPILMSKIKARYGDF